MQRRATGREHLQLRTTGKERGDVRRGRQEMLAVVEQQQHLTGAKRDGERLEERPIAAFTKIEGGSDGGKHEARIT